MANKKSTSKKNTTKKSVVKNEKVDHTKKIESVGEFDTDYKKIILVVSVIIIVFCLFYFLTVYITGRDTTSSTTTSSASTISYTEIMAGRSFAMPEEEYLVLYYDRSDTDLLTTYTSLVSNYRSADSHYTIYTVDMSNAMNQSYASETSNWSPSKADELAINGPTLIHFQNGVVVEYYEGDTDISNYLG